MAEIVIMGAGLGGVIMAYEMKDQLRPEDKLTVVTKDPIYHFVPSNPWVAVNWRTRESSCWQHLTRRSNPLHGNSSRRSRIGGEESPCTRAGRFRLPSLRPSSNRARPLARSTPIRPFPILRKARTIWLVVFGLSKGTGQRAELRRHGVPGASRQEPEPERFAPRFETAQAGTVDGAGGGSGERPELVGGRQADDAFWGDRLAHEGPCSGG